MEGYVTLRSSFFSNKVWAVLDRQTLSFYEKIDLNLQRPLGVKGVVEVSDAKIMKLSDKKNPFGISITTSVGSVHLFNCPDDNACSSWYNSLIRAVVLHSEEEKKERELFAYRSDLGISADEILSKSLITKAYRKICLQVHPDRGGDKDEFNRIHRSYHNLLVHQEAEDERENSEYIYYEAIIEKGGQGVGVGLHVIEDNVRKRIVVQGLSDKLLLHALSAEANKEIRPGDALVSIDDDDCTHWPISRLRARVSNFRIPVHTEVRLTFERRVPKPKTVVEECKSPVGKADIKSVFNVAPIDETTAPMSWDDLAKRSDNTKKSDNVIHGTRGQNHCSSEKPSSTKCHSVNEEIASGISKGDLPLDKNPSKEQDPIVDIDIDIDIDLDIDLTINTNVEESVCEALSEELENNSSNVSREEDVMEYQDENISVADNSTSFSSVKDEKDGSDYLASVISESTPIKESPIVQDRVSPNSVLSSPSYSNEQSYDHDDGHSSAREDRHLSSSHNSSMNINGNSSSDGKDVSLQQHYLDEIDR